MLVGGMKGATLKTRQNLDCFVTPK